MSKWEKFEHANFIMGVRMPSENRTKYGAVRYVTIGGFDSEIPEHVAEARAIVDMIADAPALLDALELCALVLAGESLSKRSLTDALEKARALIAKHRGGV